MSVQILVGPVEGLDRALAVVEAFDRVLIGGLMRPRPAQAAALADLADAVAASPLALLVAQAAEKTEAGTASEEHFLALAAARTALLGAAHDALAQRVDEATGRGRHTAEAPAAPPVSETVPVNLLSAARSWLCDVARAGWQGLDHDLAAGAAPVVAAMLPDLGLRRLAVLLDGFAAELAACCPGAAMDQFPLRRWADLWTRGLLLAHPTYAPAIAERTVTGRLLPLGVDLQEHPTAAQAQVHAVLEPADGSATRLVRVSVSTAKTDTIVGAGVWQLLRPHLSLLAAAAQGRSVEVTAMPVTAEGDLLWSEALARTGAAADPFATARVALAGAEGGWKAPLDRHPAALAEPMFLEGYQATEQDGDVVFTAGGHTLAVDVDRIPAACPLTLRSVTASTACIGLLRWDAGRFVLQPLAVTGRNATALHTSAWADGTTDKDGIRAEKAATDAVQVLRERAGKLLRT
ncbi:hypothetical protein ABH941_004750 [Streptacidiphilus sp. EB103A]